ncbi:MAG: hypothetical protein ACK559_24120, partial [bacterium]
MAARLREAGFKPPGRRAAGRDLRDPQARPRHAILLQFDLHVAHAHGRVVAHRHLQRQQHVGRRHAPDHLQALHREVARRVRRRIEGAIVEPQFHARIG